MFFSVCYAEKATSYINTISKEVKIKIDIPINVEGVIKFIPAVLHAAGIGITNEQPPGTRSLMFIKKCVTPENCSEWNEDLTTEQKALLSTDYTDPDDAKEFFGSGLAKEGYKKIEKEGIDVDIDE